MDKSSKHFKTIISHHSQTDDQSILLPGLPNHLAHLCLVSLPPSLLSSVCRSWRRLIYSPSFPPFFSLYALVSPTSPENHHSNTIEFFSFDPISLTWKQLPCPSRNPPITLLHRHPSFISRDLPIQSVSILNRLVIISATDNQFGPALAHPLVFDPLSAQNQWTIGPPLANPRRWCATGSSGGSLYVASGLGSCYHGDVARSMVRWDIGKNVKEWKWEKLARLKDGRFSREAIDGICYKGKIYMVNNKQGGVYDVAHDRWEEMPVGMLAGWNGPAGSTTDGEENMYVVDEKIGILSKYDQGKDTWEKVFECVEYLKGAKQIVVGKGKVCVLCANGVRIVVVDVAEQPPRHWVVCPPPGMEVVSLQILPRMCRSE